MAAVESDTEFETIDTRDARALTTPMTVMDDVGMVADADGLFEVTTDSGREYVVDLDAPAGARCLCKDFQYRSGDCKHIRRVRYEVGDEPIPSWVDPDDVDDQLGAHLVSGEPRWSA